MTSNRRHKKEASARLKKKQKVERQFTRMALDVLNKHRGKPMAVAELLSAMKLPAHERQRGAASLSSSLYKKVMSGPLIRVKNFGVRGGYGYVWPVREPSLGGVQRVVIDVLKETLTWRDYRYVNEQASTTLFGRHDYEGVAHLAVLTLWREGLVDLDQGWPGELENMSPATRQKTIPVMTTCRCRLTVNSVLKERTRVWT